MLSRYAFRLPRPLLTVGGSIDRLARDPSALLAGLVLALLVGAALAAPFLWPYDPYRMEFAQRLLSPSLDHPLGTDEFGRDMALAVVHGGRLSLLAAGLVVLAATTVGLGMALLAGISRKIDYALSRIVDVWLAMPALLLALVIVSTLGAGVTNAMLAVAIALTPGYFRLVRSEVLALRVREFVEAARAVGATEYRVVTRHVLPNTIPTVIVISTLQFGAAIVALGSLSFLGLGAAAPSPEWGALIASGRQHLRDAVWLVGAPGGAMLATVLALNILGDGLRDALDPRMK